MGRKIFFSSFAAIFSLLLVIQGYFALDDDAAKELRARRIGASFVDFTEKVAEAGEEISGLSVYLTMETEGNRSSNGQLFVNGAYAGNLKQGILTIQVREGDEIALKNAAGSRVRITDYPDGLDKTALPSVIDGADSSVKWGKIVFR